VIGRNVALSAVLLIFAALGVSAESSLAQNTVAKKKTTNAQKSIAPRPSSQKAAARKSTGKGSTKKGKKSSRRQPGQKAPSSDRISEIQSALAKDGSFTGTPNGKWDDSTVDAMKKFQSAHGLNPTGRLDAPTLQKLGLGSSTAGVAAPQAPPGAVSRLTSSKFNSAEPSSEDQQ
jgi:peptidoglycan hydrolase-like protein with peptidoglycan-binding domain